MCGASKEEKEMQKQQAKLSKFMLDDARSWTATNKNIMDSIITAMKPISSDPFQFGFSPEEEAAMRGEAIDTTARAGQNAQIAAQSQQAARSGQSFIPSGADQQINAMINAEAGFRNSEAQRDITQAGYATGRQNFFAANQALALAPGQIQNPSTNANLGASESTGQAFDQAKAIREANHAWLGALGGVVGGVLGGPMGAAVGSHITRQK